MFEREHQPAFFSQGGHIPCPFTIKLPAFIRE
jgi:hypothetical protein